MRQLKITKSITNRESQSLEKYLQEIGKVELISSEEEVKLATLIRQGDQKALDRLTKANLRFVVSVAKQYQNQGLQALAEQSRIVRLPLNKVGLTNRIQKAYSLLEQQFEREPSAEELAEVLEMDIDEVTATLGINGRHVSMDSPLSDGEENTLMDVLENANADKTDGELVHNESLKTEIDRSLKTLTERQKEVICFFFGIGVDHPMSLEDIGERFSLTRERVRQIKDKAITKLKASNRCQLLRTYLGT